MQKPQRALNILDYATESFLKRHLAMKGELTQLAGSSPQIADLLQLIERRLAAFSSYDGSTAKPPALPVNIFRLRRRAINALANADLVFLEATAKARDNARKTTYEEQMEHLLDDRARLLAELALPKE